MVQQVPLAEDAIISDSGDEGFIAVTPDIAYKRVLFVNVIFLGTSENWLLVDAGVAGTASFIRSAAQSRFGDQARPRAILLTHGHFDHVGALRTLSEEWDVPIYAHEKELPFLNGTGSYPPPSTSAGGGMMTWLSRFFPTHPIDVSSRLQALPPDGVVPFLSEWTWIATPGHSRGHISLWRERDRVLVSGDAVITTAQESAYGAITQEPEIHGPPRYFTPDWTAAEESVRLINSLQPSLLIPGHGRAAEGELMRRGLQELEQKFRRIAVPEKGKYAAT